MTSKRKPAKQLTQNQPKPVLESIGSDTALGGKLPEEEATVESPLQFPVVGIGASAGGLAAYEAFFSGLPADQEIETAFVIVQHMSPDHKSLLAELVRRRTQMPVHDVQDGMEVEPNNIYIIPPNTDLALEGRTLRLSPPAAPRGHRLPIDFFFRSLARELRERAICVVLSGTGSDGTLGVRAIKGEGGMVMTQEPSTAEHDGMPRSAIATGLVDYVLQPSEMVRQLISYTRHAFGKKPSSDAERRPDGATLGNLTALLRAQTGHDFSQYKSTTLLRRMERRMALNQFRTHDDYFRFMRDNPGEIEALFRDLLIGVTNFFRDPAAFRILEEKVIPRLMEGKGSYDPFRAWICGCSTGEEAYSIAILLQEFLETWKRPVKVQLFATDIDHLAIDQARAGIFPASIAADVSAERLSRFFVHDSQRDVYRVQKVLRDMLVFSEQDVVQDPPFSKLDLISCRNLLIYLSGEAQQRLLPVFHYALNPGGVLFLGSSETIGEFAQHFSAIDRKGKLFLREAGDPQTRYGAGEFVPRVADSKLQPRAHTAAAAASPVPTSWRQLTEQALLTHYSEAAVLVNGRGDILYIHGRTGRYLEPSSGDAALNVLGMAREGLRRELTSALHRAVAHRKSVEYRMIRVRSNGGFVSVDVTVNPLAMPNGTADLYLVILQETPPSDARTGLADATPAESAEFGNRVTELEQELRAKEDYLQTTLEEMETTHEELKSINEEMQSVNEELQSTNEELETSKEELQSVNEELSTVNAELQDKVNDLSRLNNDMNNLLAGTGVGTVFVDHSLRIIRFTPAAQQVINFIPSDLGRPVDHIVPNLVGYDSLREDLLTVLDTLQPKEKEVVNRSGAWYLMRIGPYRTTDNAIEGAVLTFVDISERKRAEQRLSASEALFNSILNQAFAGVTQSNLDGRITYVNDRLCEMLGYTRSELLNLKAIDFVHADDKARGKVALESLHRGGPDFSIERRYVRRDLGVIWVADRVSAIREDGKVTSVVTVSFDRSSRQRLESEASLGDARLTGQLDALSRLDGMQSLSISDRNQAAVLDEILGAAIAINRADKGTLQVCDADGKLVIIAQRGFDPEYLEFWNGAAPGTGTCGRALDHRRQVFVEDVTQSRDVQQPELDMQLHAGIRAVQSIPLVTRTGKVVGVMSTHFRSTQRPDPQKERLFEMFAREVADIVEQRIMAEPMKAHDETEA